MNELIDAINHSEYLRRNIKEIRMNPEYKRAILSLHPINQKLESLTKFMGHPVTISEEVIDFEIILEPL